MPCPWTVIDALLSPADAGLVSDALRLLGRFRLYSEEGRSDGLAAGLPERYDLARAVLGADGGEFAWQRATRLNVFRETVASADQAVHPCWAWFRDHPALRAAAGSPHLLEPVSVYANAMVPGMELAAHDDVPAFRGLDRRTVPQWLLVVMRRSGLFARWHIPTVHVISWWSATPGGAFLLGADQELASVWNHGVAGDFEAIPHGVARVGGAVEPPRLVRGGELHTSGAGWAALSPTGQTLAWYPADDVRLSLSWRARVFVDEQDRRRLAEHTDDLDLEPALSALTGELKARGVLPARAPRPRARVFAKLLVDTWPTP